MPLPFSSGSDYAANIEKAEAQPPQQARPAATEEKTIVDTPGKHSIDEVSEFLEIEASQLPENTPGGRH